MSWILEFLNDSEHRTISLSEGEIIIGRDASCQVVLPDRSVSRRHARMEVTDAQLLVRDLNSLNGTLVNNRRIQEPVALKTGDVLKIGRYTLRIRQEQDREENQTSRTGGVFVPYFEITGTGEKLKMPTVPFYLGLDEKGKRILGTTDPYLSTNLVKIRLEGGQFTVHNMYDREDILLNGQGFHKEPLRDADEIVLGGRSCHFRFVPEAKALSNEEKPRKKPLLKRLGSLFSRRQMENRAEK